MDQYVTHNIPDPEVNGSCGGRFTNVKIKTIFATSKEKL